MPVFRPDAWEDYAAGTGVDRFAWWCETHLRLSQSQWAGKPMVLEPSWQRPIMAEALATNADGTPYWTTVVMVVPRKCAKTTTLAAFAMYSLDEGEGDPEILLAASSDKQAGRLFNACSSFRRKSPHLSARLVARDYIGEIAKIDGDGRIERLSSSGDTQHGANPSLVVCDELHVWRTPKLIRSWGALTTADGARNDTQVFAITTEGEANGRPDSILGQLVDGNEMAGECEKHRGLTISRDHESRTIVFHFQAVDPKAADPRPLRRAIGDGDEAAAAALERTLLDSVMPANPASWITEEYIARQAKSAKVMPTDFLQLHACIAAEARDVWISAEDWDARYVEGMEIPERSVGAMGADGSRTWDTTVVAWACPYDDGAGRRIRIGCNVFSVREDVAHHTLHNGKIDYDDVEQFAVGKFVDLDIVEAAYDPRYLDRSAELIDRRLPTASIFPVEPMSKHMREALQEFERCVVEGEIEHDGDPVVAAHLANCMIERGERGEVRRVRRIDQNLPIDAVPALALAVWRASVGDMEDAVPLVAFV